MIVREFMTRSPLTVGLDTSLDQVLELMDLHDIRHLPVVDGEQVVGVLSDRDVLSATGWMPSRVAPARGGSLEDEPPTTVREIAHLDVVLVNPDDSLVMAAVELFGRGIGCLPVKNGTLDGILTEMDLLRAFVHVVRRGGLAGEVDPEVGSRMVHDVVSIGVDADLGQAEELLRSIHARHLLVTSGDDVVGILSDRDLRRARGMGSGDEAPVDELMTERIWTLEPRARLSDAAKGMLDHKVSALPVLDGDRLVGILTLTDLLDHSLEVLRDPEEVGPD